MKVMISIPMDGEMESVIKMKMEKLINKFNKLHIEVVDSYFREDPPQEYNNKGLYYMARSIEVMARCDAIFFADGWQRSKGCQVERLVAQQYGLKILDKEFLEEPCIETIKLFADDKIVISKDKISPWNKPDTYGVQLCNKADDNHHVPHID